MHARLYGNIRINDKVIGVFICWYNVTLCISFYLGEDALISIRGRSVAHLVRQQSDMVQEVHLRKQETCFHV